LLVDPTDLSRSPATRTFLQTNASTIDRLIVAGGPAAVSDGVGQEAANSLNR
jgi:hypothetical protein